MLDADAEPFGRARSCLAHKSAELLVEPVDLLVNYDWRAAIQHPSCAPGTQDPPDRWQLDWKFLRQSASCFGTQLRDVDGRCARY